MNSPEEDEFLRELGERNLSVIRQVAAGMHLSNVEVAITYDNRIDVKEFTIRGLLLPPPLYQKEYRSDYQD